MNYRLTDVAIKSSVMLALGSSIFAPYSILAQRYRQNDHTNKTWTNLLRMDIESIINNNITGTSRDPEIHMRQRDRPSREWHHSPSRFDRPPTDNRSSRTHHDDAYHYDGRKRSNAQPTNPSHPPQDGVQPPPIAKLKPHAPN